MEELYVEGNRLIRDQIDNDISLLQQQLEEAVPMLNQDQRSAFEQLLPDMKPVNPESFLSMDLEGQGKRFWRTHCSSENVQMGTLRLLSPHQASLHFFLKRAGRHILDSRYRCS
ncbi:hypothetical protein PsorP6_013914 [Peronosclerospora sorghi]|uniref:Uncharacterized protein n=1 Tax=Peronosclerospora sorghi TaxID=230839 RepID=A0ACC0VG71_9STRA|nr:hypothetical protein PsorP6_013914 [Peronosclerospora sorghi]